MKQTNYPMKNAKMQYALTSHSAMRDAKGRFYCRALHTVMEGPFCYCESCPVFGGFLPGLDGDLVPTCYYYDMDALHEEESTPDEEYQRISGLLLAGVAPLFPDFLEELPQTEAYRVMERAIQYAAVAHEGATRKGTAIPYIAHPMEAMMLTAHMTADNDVIAAAALHDVVEDTPITIEEISEEFGEKIACYVAHESENKREDQPKSATWKIRKSEQLEGTKNAAREVKMIMLADKLSNMRASLRDYQVQGHDIWKKFNMTDEAEQRWYYYAVADVLRDLSDLPAYQEYVGILEQVFQDSI